MAPDISFLLSYSPSCKRYFQSFLTETHLWLWLSHIFSHIDCSRHYCGLFSFVAYISVRIYHENACLITLLIMFPNCTTKVTYLAPSWNWVWVYSYIKNNNIFPKRRWRQICYLCSILKCYFLTFGLSTYGVHRFCEYLTVSNNQDQLEWV